MRLAHSCAFAPSCVVVKASAKVCDRLLKLALSYPEAWEDHPWDETVVKVRKGKISDFKDFNLKLEFRAAPNPQQTHCGASPPFGRSNHAAHQRKPGSFPVATAARSVRLARALRSRWWVLRPAHA